MQKDYFSYFSFKAKLEYEKKLYHLKIRLYYNSGMRRKEWEVLSDDFSGPGKLLVNQFISDKRIYEWMDINSQDNTPFVQELGSIIFKKNI